MKGFLISLLFITILKLVSNSSTDSTPSIEDSDTNDTSASICNNAITHKTEFDADLSHLVVDRNNGRVFVGGRNHLYELSTNLDVVATVKTGPRNDSDCERNQTHKHTDNINKVLLIDYSTGRLITCGSLFQGVCSVRSLQNITSPEQDVVDAIVGNSEHASTVAFIAPGPPSPPITNVMYVGVSSAGNSSNRSEIPAVASRSLDQSRMFKLASLAGETGTRMFIDPNSRESYPVNYVYGFSSERFSYFLTTQLKTHNTPTLSKEYITKLVRICHEDSHYYSYTEIPVDCVGEGIKYNLVQAAYLGKSGADLADDLGIARQDDVLYAVFSEGKDDVPSNRSALCVYSLKSIRRKFLQNIKSCFNGHGLRGLDFILPNAPCVATKLQTISEDFCGLNVNYPLGGELAIAAVPVATFEKQLTAVAATRTNDFTVVFVGTIDGHVKKVVVESASSAIEYADIQIDENSPVNADMHFDLPERNLYVMTKNRVTKMKSYDCTVFSTCAECLGAKDPFCGWCSSENKCSLRSHCDDYSDDPLFWITYKRGKCMKNATHKKDL